jgi:FtsP/CotA-like multicopper oxidase with cupredoxin domain
MVPVTKSGKLGGAQRALAARAALGIGLSDPAVQPKFQVYAPNALDPGFRFSSANNKFKIIASESMQQTGLWDPGTEEFLWTPVWGYGENGRTPTWPGRTFEVQSGVPVEVKWENKLKGQHLLPVDTSLHWAYSLPGYEGYAIEKDGVPIVSHLHGGHTDFQYDGNPEFFFSPGYTIRGPQWVDKKYLYDNSQPAGTLWYHDHALGITRLNVYAGLAGFYIVRDNYDTGLIGNDLDLPAGPYELAYAIQDRMFLETGELFYPAFPGDPFYADFIGGEVPGGALPDPPFLNGGPTALAEFFGDHMVVNGKIWPKVDVEPRNYRMRLLNGTDSRFMAIQFFEVPPEAEGFTGAMTQLDFTVIGSDQGLASSPTTLDTLLFEPGARYDIVLDFKQVTEGNRVIMKNIGGDEPFGGDIPGPTGFEFTDRVMAFDVVLPMDSNVLDVSPVDGNGDPNFAALGFGPNVGSPTRLRKVALFEGKDEFGRLQPLLGTAEPATDYLGNDINWPATAEYQNAVLPDGTSSPLIGPMEGSIAWHSPTTENPALDSIEEWEVWNVTGDAHPVHLHLVHFKVLNREEIKWDSNADDDGFIPDGMSPAGDGTYLMPQPTVQHNSVAGDPSTYGQGFRIVNPTGTGVLLPPPDNYVENARKDMVTALPGQITRIKAEFDKPGRYVWHCHILSHEDHEMMRVLYVGPGA